MNARILCFVLSAVLLAGCQGVAVMTPSGRAQTASPPPDLAALTQKADTGDVWAQTRLGRLYETGDPSVQKDSGKAFALYKLAATQGSAEAQNRLAGFYRDGKGPVSRNEQQALDLYLRAANQGHAWAQYNAGTMLAGGKGTKSPDLQAAYFWLRAAATAPKPISRAAESAQTVAKKLTPTQVSALESRLKAWKPKRERAPAH